MTDKENDMIIVEKVEKGRKPHSKSAHRATSWYKYHELDRAKGQKKFSPTKTITAKNYADNKSRRDCYYWDFDFRTTGREEAKEFADAISEANNFAEENEMFSVDNTGNVSANNKAGTCSATIAELMVNKLYLLF